MTAIAKDGLAALTMSALADRLGTSGGHILYYFGSKDRLLLEALRWSEAALTEERRALLSGRTAPAQTRPLPSAVPAEGAARPALDAVDRALGARRGERTAPYRTAQEELDQGWQEDLATLLAQGAAAGVFAVDDGAGRADQLLALLGGLSTRVVLGQRGADRKGALASARSAARRLVGRAAE
ncbi:TetR/AcrR family transcriptional regulator [Streptomyces sp. NPDC018059]|uniref:TetR/AcrR family transcriptional regulator n=1 Tax=Streptomyces sp. NPDC018059 TaxID=3365041 RepID=UPI0037AFAAA4